MSRGTCIIVNPRAGGNGATDRETEVRDALAAAGLRAEIRPLAESQTPGAAARAAIEEGYGTIVAAGGDGTISGVADAVLKADGDVRLGLLPFGTFNFFARGLDLPLDPAGAAAVLKAGATREVRIGTVNGRAFLNNMSIGLYPSILERREDVYARWGRSRPAAYWSVLTTLTDMHAPLRIDLDADGKRERLVTPLVFVGASAHQLEEYGLEGADAVREGRLALFCARKTGAAELVHSAGALAVGHARKGEEFDIRTARSFELRLGRGEILVARDGERETMSTPLRVAFSDRPIHVVAPRAA